jgi:flavin-dependent dehydrogenase
MPFETDVAVIGGGPAGAVVALTLAKLGLRNTLLETRAAPIWKIGETLAPESRPILRALGVWNQFEKDGHLPSVGNCSVWGSDQKTLHLGAMLETYGYTFPVSPRLTSAHSGRIQPYHGEGWLAAGDAAQSFDPISGQGIFAALLSGKRAAQALAEDWPQTGTAVTEYALWLEWLWRRFLNDRRAYYETGRWRHHSFWRRT